VNVFTTKTNISRRTILRGAGATLALPFLEAMVPTLQQQAQARSALTKEVHHRTTLRFRSYDTTIGFPNSLPVDASSCQLAFYEASVARLQALHDELTRSDNTILRLKALLKYLNDRIAAFLAAVRTPQFLQDSLLIQSRYYVLHGEHPPKVSGHFVFGSINLSGGYPA
jgi:hypothetical protein